MEGPGGDSGIVGDPVIAVIVPSNRPERKDAWLDAWAEELSDGRCDLYWIDDDRTTWTELDRRLGSKSWVIPRRTDCIRSWGFLQAYWDGADHFITLDDDCFPHTPDYVTSHLGILDHPGGWISTISGLVPRGMPRNQYRSVVGISHGLWSNVPDLDGATQLITPTPYRYDPVNQWIPAGMFFPMSGMNLAWKRELTPAMWFGLQGQDPTGRPWGYERFGDIWCGLFAKRVCDHLGYAVHSGHPLVRHDRASDPVKNELAERPGKEVNESLWQRVASPRLSARTVGSAYRELAGQVDLPNTPYWDKWRAGVEIWTDLLTRGA